MRSTTNEWLALGFNCGQRCKPSIEENKLRMAKWVRKTTLFNLLTGFFLPSSGRVFFQGRDITRLSPERVSMEYRAFQLVSVFNQSMGKSGSCITWLQVSSLILEVFNLFFS